MKMKALAKITLSTFAVAAFLWSGGYGFAAPDGITPGAIKTEGFKPVGAGEEGSVQAAELPTDRISLDLRNIEVSEALRFLAMRAHLNLIISKSVSGRVFLLLNDVPTKDVLDIILLSSGLAYVKQGEVYQIMTEQEYKLKYGRDFADARKIKIFRLQYAVPDRVFSAIEALKSEVGRVLVDQESGMVLVMDTPQNLDEIEKVITTLEKKRIVKSFTLQYAKAKDLEERLKPQLDGKGAGTVQADERTNQLVIQTFPERMDQIEKMIRFLDQKTKAVLIVAKIIRIALNDDFESEIQWEGLLNNINLFPGYSQGWIGSHVSNPWARTGYTYVDDFINIQPTTQPSPNPGSKVFPTETFVLGQSDGEKGYEVLFKFLQTIGESRVLSSPRLTIVNNQEAKIHVGEREAYITSTTTTGSTGQNTVAESVNFIDTGIELSVTPTINDDGFVTMKIKPQISSVKRYLTTAQGNSIPIVDTSEAETTVIVKDDTTVLIAGLRRDEWSKEDKRVPYFSKLPIFGPLFRSGTKGKERTEVIVLLTPHITDGGKFITGESGNSVDNTLKDFRVYPKDLELDNKIRPTKSSGTISKLLKKVPFLSRD